MYGRSLCFYIYKVSVWHKHHVLVIFFFTDAHEQRHQVSGSLLFFLTLEGHISPALFNTTCNILFPSIWALIIHQFDRFDSVPCCKGKKRIWNQLQWNESSQGSFTYILKSRHNMATISPGLKYFILWCNLSSLGQWFQRLGWMVFYHRLKAAVYRLINVFQRTMDRFTNALWRGEGWTHEIHLEAKDTLTLARTCGGRGAFSYRWAEITRPVIVILQILWVLLNAQIWAEQAFYWITVDLKLRSSGTRLASDKWLSPHVKLKLVL